VRKFKEQIWTGWQALFRNGDVSGGLQLCVEVEPGVGASWRDRQIDHAKMRFGSRLRVAIAQLLSKPDLGNDARVGALRLAGYLADPQLAGSIEASWNLDAEKGAHLKDYLWASAQCCGNDPDRFLGPVCDAWAAMPTEGNDNMPSARDSLAAHELRWAFHKDIPVSAVGYFIKRAKVEDLRWPITYMLHGLDHPDAVEFVIRELAETDRRLEGTQSFSPFSVSATDDWRRRQEEKGRPMSRESRERLLALWQNQSNDKFIRKQAFRFWASTETEGDLNVLRSVDASDPLADSALGQRLKRKDRSAIPDFIVKLKGDTKQRSYWWHLGQGIWSDELTRTLDEELAARGVSASRDWGKTTDIDYQVSKLIMALPPTEAEALLLKHWDHLQFTDAFVQAALYVATPRMLKHVDEVIKRCPAPKQLFKHIHWNYGVRTKGRAGVAHKKQIEAIAAYLDYIEDQTLRTLAEQCNELGWFELRKQLFDDRLRDKHGRLYLDENQIISSLDRLVSDNHIYWVDHWIEQYMKSGFSPAEVIRIIGTWLATQRTFTALQLAALAVIQIGRRQDLGILTVGMEPNDSAEALVADTTFAVKRRSLG
jgi:hypothetical protein